MTRAEKVQTAQQLRAQGLLLREICERMGAPMSTVHTWLSDPDLSRQRARREGYGRRCVDCGKPINGAAGNGPNAPKRCQPCNARNSQIWTPEAVIVAIQVWAREHGGIPPAATDWNPNYAIKLGHPEKAHKFYEDDAWPLVQTVMSRFGSWNEAIRAAGYAPRPTGSRGGEDMALCVEIRERYEAGESTIGLAQAYAVSPNTIGYRVIKAGGVLRRARWAA